MSGIQAMVDFERPPRVLVVEDDDAIAQVLQRSLRLEGYDVKLAGDGISAVDLAHGFLPDLVVLDLGAPRIIGIVMTKKAFQRGQPRSAAASSRVSSSFSRLA